MTGKIWEANAERDASIRADRDAGMKLQQIGKKYGLTPARVWTILGNDIDGTSGREDNWQADLRSGADKLLRAIIRVGLRRVYHPRAGEPDGIPDMPPDDIRARARELGLLR